MHLETKIAMTQILKFQVCGVGGRVRETEMTISEAVGECYQRIWGLLIFFAY